MKSTQESDIKIITRPNIDRNIILKKVSVLSLKFTLSSRKGISSSSFRSFSFKTRATSSSSLLSSFLKSLGSTNLLLKRRRVRISLHNKLGISLCTKSASTSKIQNTNIFCKYAYVNGVKPLKFIQLIIIILIIIIKFNLHLAHLKFI